QRLNLRIDGQKATGHLTLALGGSGPYFLVHQTAYVNGEGTTHHTQVGSQAIQPTPVATPAPAAPPQPGTPNVPSNVRPPQTSAPNQTLAGAKGNLVDLDLQEVKVNAAQTPRCLCWAADGKSFYCLETSGVLRRVALEGLTETLRAELGAPCSWLS